MRVCFMLLLYAKWHVPWEKGKIGSGRCISDTPLAQDALFYAMAPGPVRSFQLSRHSVPFQSKETLDVLLRPESLP